MTKTSETAELDALISALIKQASDRLQQQLEEVQHHPKDVRDQARGSQKKRVQRRVGKQKRRHA